jgi:NADPH-dependent 2,4-dienoyl-CoA reductase/sulfur reductase-like enzyme
MTHHVILGGGPAGIHAVETIRQIDEAADVTLVCDEAPCARMVLPYHLAGSIEAGTMFTTDPAWAEERRIALAIGPRATAVDAKAQQVSLDDGRSLAYDRLLVATGSRPARPPIEGLDSRRVVDMWTVADATAFLEQDPKDVVVVGAGFIGLVILDALIKRGCRVRFLEIAPVILPRMLDADAAALIAAHLESKGIEILSGEALSGIEDTGGGCRLTLASGGTLECDLVVMATGIHANTDFLDGAGITTDAAILVDDHLRTSEDNVFAAGDVAQGPELLSDGQTVHAIQPTAIDHGRIAGANMAGLDAAYSGSLAMNVLHTQSLESCSFGRWSAADMETTGLSNPSASIHRQYVWEDDRLVGGSLVGPTSAVSGTNDAGMLKGLIQTGISLGTWKDYLKDHPLDLRRAYVASGAAKALLSSNLLTGRASTGGGYRFPPRPPKRPRSAHHAVLVTR